MIFVHRDAQDRIAAVCEWWLVNEHGQWTPDGRYVFVNQLEITPGYDSRTLLRLCIDDIARQAPQAVGAYWERRDRLRTGIRGYRRTQLVKGGMRDVAVLA